MQRLDKLWSLSVVLVLTLLMGSPVRASTLPQSGVTHIVAQGETLFRIAAKYGTSVEAICAANSIVNPSTIYAGQRLSIPGANPSAPAGSASAPGGDIHVVMPGENLFRIALRYGTTVEALAQLNGITNHNQLIVGQTLRISGDPTAPTPVHQPTLATTTHTVAAGETLTAIALHYGVTAWALAQANSLANPSLIFAGQVLTVPGVSGAEPTSPSTGAGGAKRIVVDLSEQHLYAYQGGTLLYSFTASTGMWKSPTRTGTFSVLNKLPNAYASTWDLQMPYWLGIYWSGGLQNGIHALPILSNGQQLWAGYLGTPISYGCIVLGTYEARLLYEWADVGTTVVVQW
jgi:LysM repeat protein